MNDEITYIVLLLLYVAAVSVYTVILKERLPQEINKMGKQSL